MSNHPKRFAWQNADGITSCVPSDVERDLMKIAEEVRSDPSIPDRGKALEIEHRQGQALRHFEASRNRKSRLVRLVAEIGIGGAVSLTAFAAAIAFTFWQWKTILEWLK